MTDTVPVYRRHVFVCANLRAEDHPRGSCGRKGGVHVRDLLAAHVHELRLTQVRISAAGCMGQCRRGPAIVVYPEGVWYGYGSDADIREIAETHLAGGEIVTRLLLNPAPAPQAGFSGSGHAWPGREKPA